MRPNQRVWGFLLVFAGAAPKTSGFWKMAPFSSRELAVGTGPHPDASIQKGGHECIGRVGVPSATNSGRNFSKTPPSDQELQRTKPFRPDRQAHIKGLFSGLRVVIAPAKSLGLLAPSWLGTLFPVDGIMNKTPSRTWRECGHGTGPDVQLGEMLG